MVIYYLNSISFLLFRQDNTFSLYPVQIRQVFSFTKVVLKYDAIIYCPKVYPFVKKKYIRVIVLILNDIKMPRGKNAIVMKMIIIITENTRDLNI